MTARTKKIGSRTKKSIVAEPELGNLALTEAGLAAESGPSQLISFIALLPAFNSFVLEDKKCVSNGKMKCGLVGK